MKKHGEPIWCPKHGQQDTYPNGVCLACAAEDSARFRELWASFLMKRSAAKAAGNKKYYTGKPCGHGHVSMRYVANGICCACMPRYMRNWRQRRNNEQAAGLVPITFYLDRRDVSKIRAAVDAVNAMRGVNVQAKAFVGRPADGYTGGPHDPTPRGFEEVTEGRKVPGPGPDVPPLPPGLPPPMGTKQT